MTRYVTCYDTQTLGIDCSSPILHSGEDMGIRFAKVSMAAVAVELKQKVLNQSPVRVGMGSMSHNNEYPGSQKRA